MLDAAKIETTGIDRLAQFLLAGQLLIVPLIFSTATLEAFEFNKVSVLVLVAWLLLGIQATRIVCTSDPARSGLHWLFAACREPISLGMLLFLLSAILSTVCSISPQTSLWGAPESLAGLETVSALVVLFFATRHGPWTSRGERCLLTGSIVAAGLTAAYALVQFLGSDPIAWRGSNVGSYVRPFGTLGHPNHLAAYLVMTLPLAAEAVWRAAQRRRWLALTATGFVLAVALVALATTLSGGGAVAFAVMFLTLIAGWSYLGRRRTAVALASTLLLAVVLGAGAVLCSPAGTLLTRARAWANPSSRCEVWRAAWEIFARHPVTGSGLDTFALAFPPWRTVEYVQLEWGHTPTRAHNELLHVLATQGLLGGAALLFLVGGLAYSARRAWRAGPVRDRPLLVALLAGCSGFLVVSMVSFTVGSTATFFVSCCALLARRSAVPASPQLADGRRAPFSWLRAGCLAVIWAGVGVAIYRCVVLPQQASRACCRGESYLAAGDLAALADFRQAAKLQPKSSIYWRRLGIAGRELAGQPGLDIKRRQRLLRDAQAALQRAVALTPVDFSLHADLGVVLGDLAGEGLESPDAPFVEFERALTLDPVNEQLFAQAAQTALGLGQFERTIHYASRGSALYPGCGLFHAQCGYVAFRTGKLGDAERELRVALTGYFRDWTLFIRTRATLAEVLLAQGKPAAACALARQVVSRMPDWSYARFTLAQALEQLERNDEALLEYQRVHAQHPAQQAVEQAIARLQRGERGASTP